MLLEFKKWLYRNMTNVLLFTIPMIIILVPWLFTMESFTGVNYSDTGAIGDTIGGLTAPFLNTIAILVVYLAFKAQIDANAGFRRMEDKKINLEEFHSLRVQLELIREQLETIVSTINKRNSQLALMQSMTLDIELKNAQLFIREFNYLFNQLDSDKYSDMNLMDRLMFIYEIYLEENCGRIREWTAKIPLDRAEYFESFDVVSTGIKELHENMDAHRKLSVRHTLDEVEKKKAKIIRKLIKSLEVKDAEKEGDNKQE